MSIAFIEWGLVALFLTAATFLLTGLVAIVILLVERRRK